MTTSQNTTLSEVLSGGQLPLTGETIPTGRRAYFQERLKGRVYSWLIGEFQRQKNLRSDLSQRDIARRLDKRPEQINRWFSGPSNLTLETLSDLVLGICGGEPTLSAIPLQPKAHMQPGAESAEDALQRSIGEPQMAGALREAGRRAPENQIAKYTNRLSLVPQPQGAYRGNVDSDLHQQRHAANSNENSAPSGMLVQS
jgi:hypothetical protein